MKQSLVVRSLLALALVFVCASTVSAQTSWVETSIVGTNPDNSKAPTAIYIGGDFAAWRDQDAQPIPMEPRQWYTLTLPYTVPADTRAVFLSGLLVITNPPAIGICNVTAAFRAPGSDLDPGNYQLQALSTSGSGGVRAPASTFVPIVNRQYEFYYTRTAGCPTLINLSLQAYFRGEAVAPPTAPTPTITASVGSVITATVTNGPGHPTDWVGLCQVTCSDWKYLSNSRTPAAGVTSATVTFPLPAPGVYTLKLFTNDSFVVVAVSVPVTVGGP